MERVPLPAVRPAGSHLATRHAAHVPWRGLGRTGLCGLDQTCLDSRRCSHGGVVRACVGRLHVFLPHGSLGTGRVSNHPHHRAWAGRRQQHRRRVLADVWQNCSFPLVFGSAPGSNSGRIGLHRFCNRLGNGRLAAARWGSSAKLDPKSNGTHRRRYATPRYGFWLSRYGPVLV